MMILISILALGVLVFVHELGHFLFAKWNGVGVVEFAIGFGKPLYQFQSGETTYSLRLIPLGGFVRMVGDDPRALEPKSDSEDVEEDIGYPDIDRDRWFLTQGFWAKASIVIAGPLFNVLFAILLSFLSYSVFGRPTLVPEPVIGGTLPDYPAAEAGLVEGDRIYSVNGTVVDSWQGMAQLIASSGGKELTLEVDRPADGETERITFDLKGSSHAHV